MAKDMERMSGFSRN